MSIVQQDADEFIRDPEYVSDAHQRCLVQLEIAADKRTDTGYSKHWAMVDIEILRRVLDGYGYETRT